MLNISLLWFLFLGSISYKLFPFSLNDIFMIFSNLYIFLDYVLFNRSVFNSIYSKFIPKFLRIFLGLFLGISVLRLLISDQNIFFEIIRFFRANQLILSLFSTFFVLDKSLKFSNKKENNFGKLLFSIILSIFVLVTFSLIFSLLLGCENVYSARYCIAGQDSYSGNGYISSSLILLNFNILFIINKFSLNIPYKKLSIYFLSPINLIYLLLVLYESGSRGATISILMAFLVFCFYFVITRIRMFKINKFVIFVLTLAPLFLTSTIGTAISSRRSFAIFRFLLSGDFMLTIYSKRFTRYIFYKESPLWGGGNFQINSNPLGTSFYDGTFTFFAHSYGLIGIILLIILIFGLVNHYMKFNTYIKINKLEKYKDVNSILISTITFSLVASYPNELIILNNGVSMIFLMTLIFTLYSPYFYLKRYI